jgi:YihY family inner membrane protein
VNPVERVVRVIDRAQQRHTVPSVAFAVIKKYGDDTAGNLAAVLAFSGFITLFPLLLLLVTILGLVLSSDPHLRNEILNSTFAQFPLMGSELRNNVHALHRSSLIGLVIAIVLLLYGSLGLAQNGIYTMEQIWNLPGIHRSNFVKRMGRSLEFIALLGAGIIVSTFLTAVGTNTSSRPFLVDAGAVVASLLVSCAQFVAAYRVLTPPMVKTKYLLPGALVAGVGWTVLQAVGTYLLGHTLRNSSATYGVFAFVLGLVFWISLVVRLVVYSSELNVVLSRRLWPRSMVQPPLTRADREVLAAQAEQNRRRPEQQVHVTFDDLAAVADQIDQQVAAGDPPVNGGSQPVPPSDPAPGHPQPPAASALSEGPPGASSQGPG